MARKRTEKRNETELDEAAIRKLADEAVFARGRAYRDEGAVLDLVRRGDTVTARVEGSDAYRVTVRIDDGEVEDYACTCPYEWGGACKHVVATLLTLIEAPGEAQERPSLAELIGRLDRDALARLLLRRAEIDPNLAGWIEAECAAAPGGRADPAPVAAQARAVLAGRYAARDYWDDYQPAGDPAELRDLVDKAVPRLEAGDGRGALGILEAVAEVFVEEWIETSGGYDDETLYPLFQDLGRMMAEAALMSDLDEDERAALADTITDWDAALAEYGVEDSFALAVRALEIGWDPPALLAILNGEGGTWPPEDESDWTEQELTAVRLRVLAAAGRHDAYLHLARAGEAHAAAALMLVRLGRIEEAVAYARKAFRHPDDALALARALDRAGRAEESLAVAEAGLSFEPDASDSMRGAHSVVPLARWLREAAAESGRADLALKAARTAFAGSLERADFEAAQAAAGSKWTIVRRDLLKTLRAAERAPERTEILLDEGLVDEAVNDVGEAPGYAVPEAVLLRLMEAAQSSHSDWVIRVARSRADAIMNAGAAGDYERAAEWLRRAALAHESAGLIDEWSATIEALIERHRRKYKLRPLLEALRF
ncbi:hypothetical protein ASG52_00575 [Methylobacterium sp. Leaf456]|uniref:SWIM zinc finger family protein n=1 Tax=Methylobacterium sp. Leaf456 TaxID=1736382 RepID=UPI0006FA28C4|nr:SWIM zinc finger family protein [Methylobacterium sp. Leaf456]KQT61418.1 hypothetical protein ASG52_00575 [Methylobacterium sp. Leaf456]